jgi:thiol:disulfide interchange protein
VRRSLFLLGTLLLAWSLGATLTSRAAEPTATTSVKHGLITWQSSFEEALKLAGQKKKPLLVDFYADWCTTCEDMARTTYKDKRVVARAKQFIPVIVNFDKQTDIVKKYDVEALPTILFLDSQGKVLLKSLGYQKAPAFAKLMDKATRKAAKH